MTQAKHINPVGTWCQNNRRHFDIMCLLGRHKYDTNILTITARFKHLQLQEQGIALCDSVNFSQLPDFSDWNSHVSIINSSEFQDWKNRFQNSSGDFLSVAKQNLIINRSPCIIYLVHCIVGDPSKTYLNVHVWRKLTCTIVKTDILCSV